MTIQANEQLLIIAFNISFLASKQNRIPKNGFQMYTHRILTILAVFSPDWNVIQVLKTVSYPENRNSESNWKKEEEFC